MSDRLITSVAGRARAIGQREFIVLMAALMSLNALGIDTMLPALDHIASELAVPDPNRRQLVVGVFLVAGAIGSLGPGLYADRFGRRPVVIACMALYAVSSLLCAIAPTFESLLALRVVQGLGASGAMVLPAAIIRDRFSGDKMARLMSVIFIVFMIVPVLAPTLGQAVMLVASWHWIFVMLAVLAGTVMAWSWARLPETLPEALHQPIDPRTILHNLPLTFRTRSAVGYVFGGGLTFGGLFGYINCSQQLIGEHFGQAENFPLIFGATASTLAVTSFVNSRIVERFGARRVSHAALLAFVFVSLAQIYAATAHGNSLIWFLPLMSLNLSLLGFMGANFSSIAMQPFAESAGAAASVQAFIRTLVGALVGIAIGQAYDGSALPLAEALLASSLVALALVMFSEKGRLFRRLNRPGLPT